MGRYFPQILLVTALLLNAAANVLIKYSATRVRPSEASATLLERLLDRFHPTFLLGLALLAANVFAYQASLRTLRISVAYPIMVSGGFVLILLCSWYLFGERLNAPQYAGIGLILAGIWLVVR